METSNAFRDYLEVLRRQAWLIVLIPLVALAGAREITNHQQKVYRAEMKLVVAQTGGTAQPVIGATGLTQTMTGLLESEVVAGAVIQRLRLDTTSKQFQKHLKVAVTPESSILDVSYDSPQPRQAVRVLVSTSSVFTRLVDQKLGVQSTGSALGSDAAKPRVFASLFDPPHLLPDAVAPKPGKTMIFATILALALALVLAFARESLDDRLRRRRDVEDAFGAPVIVALPKNRRRGRSGRDRSYERLRTLAANIGLVRKQAPGPTILVTSAAGEETKSPIAADIARALALLGKNVICVDADLEEAKLYRHLGVPRDGLGFADVVSGSIDVGEALRNIEAVPAVPPAVVEQPSGASTATATAKVPEIPTLRALASAERVPAFALLGLNGRFSELARRMRDDADYVVLNGPPLLDVGDAFPLALQCDSVLVVAEQGRTTRTQAQEAMAKLEALGASRVGVVFVGT